MAALVVTGTRHPPPPAQAAALLDHLHALCHTEFSPTTETHDGGCTGADALFRGIVRDLWGHGVTCVCHPMLDAPAGFVDLTDANEVRPALPNRERNENLARVVATVCLALPALPEHHPDARRSGTWQTVRLFRKCNRGIIFFWPDGTLTTWAP